MARIDLPDGEGTDISRALAAQPAFAKAVATYEAAVAHSTLDWRLHELVRMRIAQINDCTLCLSWRTPQAVAAGATEELLAGVGDTSHRADYTDAEQAALEYAERFCTDSTSIGDDLMARLSEHFSGSDMVELTLVVAKYLAFGRFMQVLGLDQVCATDFLAAR